MIVYSKFNLSRKPLFQIDTRINKNGNKLTSRKKAHTDESVEFLNSLYSKYKELMSNNFGFVPIKPQKISNTEIAFEYLEEPTLEYLLFSSLTNNQIEKYVELIKEYASRVKKGSIVNSNVNSDFKKLFGNLGTNSKADCTKIGCIDINFDNVMVSKNKKFKLIDYEWTFINTPIPYKYIIFRALISFYHGFSSYNLNHYYPLKKLFKDLKITLTEQKHFIYYEYNFQAYVQNNSFTNSTQLQDYYKFLDQILIQGSSKEHVQKTSKDIIEQDHRIEKLSTEIEKIKSSTTYKIWQKYCQLRNKLLKLE